MVFGAPLERILMGHDPGSWVRISYLVRKSCGGAVDVMRGMKLSFFRALSRRLIDVSMMLMIPAHTQNVCLDFEPLLIPSQVHG